VRITPWDRMPSIPPLHKGNVCGACPVPEFFPTPLCLLFGDGPPLLNFSGGFLGGGKESVLFSTLKCGPPPKGSDLLLWDSIRPRKNLWKAPLRRSNLVWGRMYLGFPPFLAKGRVFPGWPITGPFLWGNRLFFLFLWHCWFPLYGFLGTRGPGKIGFFPPSQFACFKFWLDVCGVDPVFWGRFPPGVSPCGTGPPD